VHVLTKNRRAHFDYAILETHEAGLSLLGTEVKSVKHGRMNLAGSYVIIRGGEAWLVGADIPPYQPKNAPPDYDPRRTRRLLLHKNEIRYLTGKLHEKGLTLVPLRAYVKKNLVKLELGLGKSRKKADRRELLKRRAHEREMRAAK
jgi:SsrA-binding protein